MASESASVDSRGERVTVRPGTRQDMQHVFDMIQELAEYEGEPRGPQLSLQDLIEDGFECRPAWFFSLVAERGGAVVGHALCSRAYSSWTRRAFYVEDLYVRPAARRRGVALHLLQELCRDGFECRPAWFFSLVAERGGAVVGHALCSRAYSSWTRRAFYVEDLYVRPAARRRGVALHLLQELCRMAVAEGVHRVDWHVLENNAPALGFYARLGARDLRVTEGRAAMRLDRPHIEQLARDKL